MLDSRDARLTALAAPLGLDVDAPLVIGGQYCAVLQYGELLYVSGQVPRVGNQVQVTGAAGDAASLDDARRAAEICALRALILLRQQLGTLEALAQVLKLNVYVQSAPGFTQQSEVADAASALLAQVLGAAGHAARTSVGVAQLPKNATVELDLQAASRVG